MQAGLVMLLIFFVGCTTRHPAPLPPRPALPAVRYVKPSDPRAVYGLTAEAAEALRRRDQLWQRHVEQLEKQLQQAP